MVSESGAKPTAKERLFRAIVHLRVPIVILFAILTVIGLVLKPLVGVDYRMSDYLPENAPSTLALDTMEQAYGGAIPSVRVMVEDVSVPEALQVKEKIAAAEGVVDVTWLDDVASTETPLEMQDEDVVETYYRDGCAVFSVSLEDSQELAAVNAIRAAVGPDAKLTGDSVSTAVATESTVSEIAAITVCGVAFVLLVLAVTTSSWLEPLLVLAGLGVAVSINAGSNLMFGEISFVSNAAGAVLQIAIALDFSVFLIHRLEECRGRYGSAEEDMVQALCKSSTSILASGCAVMIGFLALTVMQFRIGPDMGMVLAKGIFVSLVVVFTFLPGLMVLCEKGIRRTSHRSVIRGVGKLGKAVARVCVPLACAFALLPIPAFLASTSDGITYWYGSANIFGADTQLGQDTQRIDDVFGESTSLALLVPEGDVAQEQALSDDLHGVPQVKSITSYVDAASSAIPRAMADPSDLEQLDAGGWTRMVLTMEVSSEGAETHEAVAAVRQAAQAHYPDQWLLAGDIASTADLKSTITEDKGLVDVIAVAAVLAVLVLATRSLVLPIILVFVIETAIWCNFAVPYFSGAPVFYLSYLIVSSIQLGVTVDYAILLSDRYCEFRQTMAKKDAVNAAVRAAAIPVSTSGVVLVVVGFALSVISSHGVLAQLGHFLGVGVAMSLVAVVFVLPGYLYLFDRVIAKTKLHANFLDEELPDEKLGHSVERSCS